MSRKYKDSNKWLTRFCLNYLLKKVKNYQETQKKMQKKI